MSDFEWTIRMYREQAKTCDGMAEAERVLAGNLSSPRLSAVLRECADQRARLAERCRDAAETMEGLKCKRIAH